MKDRPLPIAVIVLLSLLTTHTISSAENRTSIKAALVSPRCVFGDVDANLLHFSELAEDAQMKGARLICFPELALVSYSIHKEVLNYAQPIPGPATKKLEALAHRLDVYLSVGMAERDGDEHYITQALVGPDGYMGKYRKSLPTKGEQICGFLPGKEYPVWDVDGFRFGILICADGRHSATIDAMKNNMVDVIHHPHGNWVGGLGREAEEWTRSKIVYFAPRAIHARAHILINNSAESTEQPDKTHLFSSGAVAIDPLGQIIKRTEQTDRSEKVIIFELKKPEALIPPGELKALKRKDPVFNKRFEKTGD